MTIEFLHEHHADKEHSAMAQLSRHISGGTIREKFAALTSHDVTFHKLKTHTKNPPETFTLSTAEADAFVEAWLDFKENTAEWEQIEAEKKAWEEQAEQDRQLAVWKEVERLAESIPGLEIIAREEERWEYSEDTGETHIIGPAWSVKLKHHSLLASTVRLYNVDQVFETVQKIIEEYHQTLEEYEDAEKQQNGQRWYGWSDMYIETAQKFLATHRAFVASKTPPLVETNA